MINLNELNIAKTLVLKRKEKGITQEELAAYIGVSKASVSKWETRSEERRVGKECRSRWSPYH